MENDGKLLKFLGILNLIILINGDKVNIPGLGIIQGSISSTTWTIQNMLQFKGIPYAESPGKGRRFQPPVPKSAWHNELDATNYGRPCPSPEYIATLNQEQLNEDLEDCLNLNVFTKNLTAKVPVMFFIHGGSFVSESGKNYPPPYLLEKDIVLVVINYRLGALGFASTQSSEIPGNVAVMDIVLALKWVQKYIQYFGGDENQVTVFGLSAGSALTSLLLISPSVPHDLFKNAILHSGVITAHWAIEMQPIDSSRMICKQSGCSTCESVNDINYCLKTASVRTLIDVVEKNEIKIRPTIDDMNYILPNIPKILIANLNSTKPVMGGITKDDGGFMFKRFYNDIRSMGTDFRNIDPIQLIENYISYELASNESIGIITNLAVRDFFNFSDIQSKNYDHLWTGFFNLATYINFAAPLINFMTLYTGKMASMNAESNYLYSFNYKGEFSRWVPGDYPFSGGVSHCDDLLYLFPFNDEELKSPNDIEISKIMLNYWTNFSTIGRPISDGMEFNPIQPNAPFLAFNVIDRELTVGDNLLDNLVVDTASSSGASCNIPAIIVLFSSILFQIFQLF